MDFWCVSMTNLAARLSMSIFLCVVLSGYSDAAELEYEIRAGAARSDNVARTETAEIEETLLWWD